MFEKHRVCVCCHKTFPSDRIIFECDRCKGPLDIVYDYQNIMKFLKRDLSEFRLAQPSHWKYWPFYPIKEANDVVSLDEGATPLLESNKHSNLLFKYEATNPTCSFKDRGSTIEISKAKEHRVKEVVCASTGNMGASVAAYSARAGLKCTIYLPVFAPKQKANQIRSYGAEVIKVRGTYDDAVKKTVELRKEKHIYLTGDYVYRGEGEKSVGFEIIDQLQFTPPKYIVMPIGNATLFSSVCKSLVEFKEVGLLKRMPKLVGVQAKGCNPIVQAFSRKKGIPFIKSPKTIATAIACGRPVDAIKALRALKETNGLVVDVTDRQILEARKELGKEGLFVEPSGAVSYAGWKKLGLKGEAVCVLTGHGLKTY
ncbi:MAG: threonine synthase [Candidatus Nanoarchaeia archaeon]